MTFRLLTRALLLGMLVTPALLAQGLPLLSIGTDRGEAGDTVQPVLRVSNPGVAVAFQCRVTVDPDALFPSNPIWVGDSMAYQMIAGTPFAGMIHLIVYSEALGILPEDLAIGLPLRIASRQPDGRLDVRLEEVRFVDATGAVLPAGPSQPGSVQVGLAEPVQPQIVAFRLEASGRLGLDISAPGALSLSIERSVNLLQWDSIGTLQPAPDGAATFIDSTDAPPDTAFYRVRVPAP